ncbi:MAG: sodium:proton exchanger [Ignavibacteriae bacterium]|nr:sodium:proton exchanger [Ignavibacteriota bacterium]
MCRKTFVRITSVVLLAVPSVVFKIFNLHTDPIISAVIFGFGIVVAAVLLTWAAEAAQIDISASFAIAILALIAVLPEYAVDIYLAFKAGSHPEYVHYAAANMTGSNRLLIGVGWTAVVFAFVLSKRLKGKKVVEVKLEPKAKLELAFLGIASVYCVFIIFLHRISIIDSIVLIILFFIYMIVVSSGEQHEPHLRETTKGFLSLTKSQRFVAVNGLFVTAGVIVYLCAQPFAESMIEIGTKFNIDKFLLVQWVAPTATEAPELLVAVIFAWRAQGEQAIGTLLSSKINQWTLLIGSLPVAYILGGGGHSLMLDARQSEEFLLTLAQTLLGFAIILNLKFHIRDAVILFSLFFIQFLFPGMQMRIYISILYFIISGVVIIMRLKFSNRFSTKKISSRNCFDLNFQTILIKK